MGSGLFNEVEPQFVTDVLKASEAVSTSEIVNIAAAGYVKDAVGSTVVVELKKKPIGDFGGSAVGSFWGDERNLQYEHQIQSVVKTDGTAAFTVSDTTIDLEKLFESVTKGRYVAKIFDKNGKALYGWIGGVSVVGSIYTFTVFNSKALATQNWFQGGAATFNAADAKNVQIFRYATSLDFGAATVITEEVPLRFPEGSKYGRGEYAILSTLSNGQYAVDYVNAKIYLRKATADDTVTATYLITAGIANLGSGATIDIGNIQELAASTTTAGTVAATNGAGGTTIIAANALRNYAQCQNNGGVDVYFGAGVVTSSFPKVVPNGVFTWDSQEALKVLSSGANCNIAFIDYTNS